MYGITISEWRPNPGPEQFTYILKNYWYVYGVKSLSNYRPLHIKEYIEILITST
jgi:hypothetical protein